MAMSARPGAAQAHPRMLGANRFTSALHIGPRCLKRGTDIQANSVNGPTWPGQPLEHVALASLIASSTATDGGISTISLSTLVFAEGLLWACADQAPDPSTPRSVHGWFREDNIKGLISNLASGAAGAAAADSGGNGKPRGPYSRGGGGHNGNQGPRYPPSGGQSWGPPDPSSCLALLCALLLAAVQRWASALEQLCSDGQHSTAAAAPASTHPAAAAALYSPPPTASASAQQQAQACRSTAEWVRGGRVGLLPHGSVSTRHVLHPAATRSSAARNRKRLCRGLRPLASTTGDLGLGVGTLQGAPQVQGGGGADTQSAPSSGARNVISGPGLGPVAVAEAGSRRRDASSSSAQLPRGRGLPSAADALSPTRTSCAAEAGQGPEPPAADALEKTLPGVQLRRTQQQALPRKQQEQQETQEQQVLPSNTLATPAPSGAWALPGTVSRPRPLLELTHTLQHSTAAEHATLLAAAPLATPLPSLFLPSASAAPCQSPSFSPTPPSSAATAVTPTDPFSATLPHRSPVTTVPSISPASHVSASSNTRPRLLPLEPALPLNTRRSLDGLSAALQVRAAASAARLELGNLGGPTSRGLRSFHSLRQLPTTLSGTHGSSSSTYWASLLCSAQECAALAQQHVHTEAAAHIANGKAGTGQEAEEEGEAQHGAAELVAASCSRGASGLAPDQDEQPGSWHQRQGHVVHGEEDQDPWDAARMQAGQAGALSQVAGAAAVGVSAAGGPRADPWVCRPGPDSSLHDAQAPGQLAALGGTLGTGTCRSTFTTAAAYLRAFASSISTSPRAPAASHRSQLQEQRPHVSAQQQQPRQPPPLPQQQHQPKVEQEVLQQGPVTPTSASRDRPCERASFDASYICRTHDQAAPPRPSLLSYFSHSSRHLQHHAIRAPSLSASPLPLTQSHGHAAEAPSASAHATVFVRAADPRALPGSTADGPGAVGHDDVCGSAGTTGPAGPGSSGSLPCQHAQEDGGRAAEGEGAEVPGEAEAAGVRGAAEVKAEAEAQRQEQRAGTREVPWAAAGAPAQVLEVGAALAEAAAAEAACVAGQQSCVGLMEAAGAASGERQVTEAVPDPGSAYANAGGVCAAAQHAGRRLAAQGAPMAATNPCTEPTSATCAQTKAPMCTLADELAAWGIEQEPGSWRPDALCDVGQQDTPMLAPVAAAQRVSGSRSTTTTTAAAAAVAADVTCTISTMVATASTNASVTATTIPSDNDTGAGATTNTEVSRAGWRDAPVEVPLEVPVEVPLEVPVEVPLEVPVEAEGCSFDAGRWLDAQGVGTEGGQDFAAGLACACAVRPALGEEAAAVPPPATAVATAMAAQKRLAPTAPGVAAIVPRATVGSEEEEAMAALALAEGAAEASEVFPGSGTQDLQTAAEPEAAAVIEGAPAQDVAAALAEAAVGAAAVPEVTAASETVATAVEATAPEAAAATEESGAPEAAAASEVATALGTAVVLEATEAPRAQAAATTAAAEAAQAEVQAGTTTAVEIDSWTGAEAPDGPEAPREAPEGAEPSAQAAVSTVEADEEPAAGNEVEAEATAAAVSLAVTKATGCHGTEVPPGPTAQAPGEAVVEAQAVGGPGCPAEALEASAVEEARGGGRAGLRSAAGHSPDPCEAAVEASEGSCRLGHLHGPGGPWALPAGDEGCTGQVAALQGEGEAGLHELPGRWCGEWEGEVAKDGETACQSRVATDTEDAAAATASSVSLAASCGSHREPRAGGTWQGSRIPHSPGAGDAGPGTRRSLSRIPLPPASGWRTAGPGKQEQPQPPPQQEQVKQGTEVDVPRRGTATEAEACRARAGGSAALPAASSPRRASYGEQSSLRRGALQSHAQSLPRLSIRAVNGAESSGPPSPALSTRSTASARSTLSRRSAFSSTSRPGSSSAAPAPPRSAFGRTVPQPRIPPAVQRTLSASAASSAASHRPNADTQHHDAQPSRSVLNSTLTFSPRPAQHSATAAAALGSTPTSPHGSTLDSSRRASSFTASPRGAGSAGTSGLETRVRSALGPSFRAKATAQQQPLSRLGVKSPSVAFGRSVAPHTAVSPRSSAAARHPADLRGGRSCSSLQPQLRSGASEAAQSALPLPEASNSNPFSRSDTPALGPPGRATEGLVRRLGSSSHSRNHSDDRCSSPDGGNGSNSPRHHADGARGPHSVLYTSVTPVPDGDPFDSPLLLPVPQIVTAGDETAADLMAVAAAAAAMPASLSEACAAEKTTAAADTADTYDTEGSAGVRPRSLRWEAAAAAAAQGCDENLQVAAGEAAGKPVSANWAPAAERPANSPHAAPVAGVRSPGLRPTGTQSLLHRQWSGHSRGSVLPHMDLREDAFAQGPLLGRSHSATGIRTEHVVGSPSRLAGSASGAVRTRLGLQCLGGGAAGALSSPRVPVGQRNRRRHSVAAYTAAGTAAAAAVTRELSEATWRRRCSTALGFVAPDACEGDAANAHPGATVAPGGVCWIGGAVGDAGGEMGTLGVGLQAGSADAGEPRLLSEPQGVTGAECKLAAERWYQQGERVDSQQKQQWPGPGAPSGTGMIFAVPPEVQEQGQGQGQRRGDAGAAMGCGSWSSDQEATVAGYAAAGEGCDGGDAGAAAAAAATPLPSPAEDVLPWPNANRGSSGAGAAEGGGGGLHRGADGGPGAPEGNLSLARDGRSWQTPWPWPRLHVSTTQSVPYHVPYHSGGVSSSSGSASSPAAYLREAGGRRGGQANGAGDSSGPNSRNSSSSRSSSGDESAFIRGASEPAYRIQRSQLPAGDAALHADRDAGRRNPDAPRPAGNGTGAGSAAGNTGGCSGGDGGSAGALLPAGQHTWFRPGSFRSRSRVLPGDAPASPWPSRTPGSGAPASPHELQKQLSSTPGTPSRHSSGLFARVSRTLSKRVMPLPPPVPLAHSSFSLHRAHSATAAAAGVLYDAAAAAAAAGDSPGSPHSRRYRRAASNQVLPYPAHDSLFGGTERPVGLSPRMPYSRTTSANKATPGHTEHGPPSPLVQLRPQPLQWHDGLLCVASSPRAQRPSRRSVSRSPSPSQPGAHRCGEVAGAAAPHGRPVGLAAASTLRHVSPRGRRHEGGARGIEEDGEQEHVAFALLQQLPPGSPAAAWLAGRRLAQRPGHHGQGQECFGEGGSGGGASAHATGEQSVRAQGSDLAVTQSAGCQEASATASASSPGAAYGAAAAGPALPTPFLGIGQRLLGLRRPETRPQQLPYEPPLLNHTRSQGPHSSPNMERGVRPTPSLMLFRSPGSRLQAPAEQGDLHLSPREASWSSAAERAALLGVQGLMTGCGSFGRRGLAREESGGEEPGGAMGVDLKPVSAGGHQQQGDAAGGSAVGLLRMASARALLRAQSGVGSGARRMHQPEWQQVYDTPEGVLRPRYSQRHIDVLQASPLASPAAWSPRPPPATGPAAAAQLLGPPPEEGSSHAISSSNGRAINGRVEGIHVEHGRTGRAMPGVDCCNTPRGASSSLGCADLSAGSASARVWHTRAERLQVLLHGPAHGQQHDRAQLEQADSDGQAHSSLEHLRRCEVLAARGADSKGGPAGHWEEASSREARAWEVEVGEGGKIGSNQQAGPCDAGQGRAARPSFGQAVISPGLSPSAVAAGQVRTPLSSGGGRREAEDPQEHAPGGAEHSSAGGDMNGSGLGGASRCEAAVGNTRAARGNQGRSSHVEYAAVALDAVTAGEAGSSEGSSSCVHGQPLVSTAYLGEALSIGSEQGAGKVGAVEKDEVAVGAAVEGSVAVERASGYNGAGGCSGGGEEGVLSLVGAQEQHVKPRRGLFERAVHKVKKVLKGQQRSGKD